MRTRGARRSGWLLLVAVAVGASVLSALGRLLPGVVGGTLLAVVGALGAALSQRGQQLIDQDTRRGQETRRALLTDGRGRLHRVRDMTDPLLVGVHPAAPEGDAGSEGARVPPFVRRDRSGDIEEALRTYPFVLVVGESTSGKTRAAFEAVRAVLPDAAFIAPDPTRAGALAAAEAALRRERDAVVWLDDIERYLGAGGLTPYLLHLHTSARDGHRTVVVGTIRVQERARYTDVQGLGPDAGDAAGRRTARDVLALAHEIRLDRRWHETELARARRMEGDRRLAQAVVQADRFGVAEYLAAGPQLFMVWQDAWAPEGTHVRGAALVAAAVEARRAGWLRPLPIGLLRELHEEQLTRHGGLALRPESWEEALAWATTPWYATSSLLLVHASQPDGYHVFDYLPDTLDEDARNAPIAADTWSRLITAADPQICEDIGWSALLHTRRTAARDAFQKALDSGVLTGAIGLALLLGEELRTEEASRILRAALRQAPVDADPETTFALRRALSWWHGGSGHAEESLALTAALLAEARLRYGDDHQETINITLDVARWTDHTGKPAEALALARAALERSVRLFGPASLTTLSCRFEVAGATASNGSAEATRLWSQLAVDGDRMLGAHHPFTVDALWNQAHAVFHGGDTRQGLRLLCTVIDGRTALYGSDHPRTFACRLQLTGWTGECGRYDEALSLLLDLVQDITRALGPHHVLTLAGRHQQAMWTSCSGRVDQARTAFATLLDECERHLGTAHELAEDCRARLTRPDRPIWRYREPSW
ncbi:hypothetical protein [Streptomyces panaciradicis]|uniref:hypothetical protein n=1 Tax=Streptomyces panaciradicis TaxID=1470261 RepID=UPI00201CD1ED|nr:hypothetical protein [Streptomyces panaciradicis]MCL6667656.1 hypothetical protein [Streptomyces panaciradicis]